LAYDLAISLEGDLVFSANGDLAGCSSDRLMRQRAMIRLKIPRGSWLFDENKDLGSDIYRYMGRSGPDLLAQVPMVVREALRPIIEMQILDVQASIAEDNDRQVEVLIAYTTVISPEEVASPLLEEGAATQTVVVRV
jgi:hypothetical protein